MEKISFVIYKSIMFLSKYASSYLLSMIKPVIVGFLSLIFAFITMALISLNPIFALLSLLSIPLFCYAFWRGYLITYALNIAGFDFLNNKTKDFKIYIEEAKKQEKPLAGFVGFFAVIIILACVPTIIAFFKLIPWQSIIIDPLHAIYDTRVVVKISILNTIIIAPIINFSLQAFFFKKKESFFKLIINCYKIPAFSGFILSNLIVLITAWLNIKFAVLYIILAIPMNLIIYPVNLFWYSSKLKDLEQA